MPASIDESDVDYSLVGDNEHDRNDERELTPRAVLSGLAIGCLLAAANLQFGLQSGWISMLSLQSALVGFGLFKVGSKLGWISRKFPFTAKENIVLQTTAVATGTMPLAAGLVGVIPALGLLDPDKDGVEPIEFSAWSLIGWCFAVAFFGVIFAVPLRRQIIVKEKLVFPSGTATAKLISVLHNRKTINESEDSYGRRSLEESESIIEDEPTSIENVHRDDNENNINEANEVENREENEKIDSSSSWLNLLASFSLSTIYIFATLAFPVLYSIPLFDIVGHPLAHKWQWWFTPSPSYIGQGIIMGLPVCISMNLGMIVGWGILSPLSYFSGWAPGQPGDSVYGARGWILWPALAIMMAESAIGLCGVVISSVNRRNAQRRERRYNEERDELLPDRERGRRKKTSIEEKDNDDGLSTSQVWGGLCVTTICCVILVSLLFGEEGIRWWATVLAVVLACIFSLLGVRAIGQTDLNPVSAIGKISQIIFGVIQPGNIVANIIAGGISEAGAQQAGDLMQDLKTGHLHGASPKAQFIGQMIGSLASVFVSSGLYILYRRTYDMPSAAYPIPTAGIWLILARLVNKGSLPEMSKEMMVIFGLVFAVFGAIKTANEISERQGNERVWLKRLSKYIPSGIPFAIGFVNTPQFSIARLIGGIVGYVVSRRSASTNDSKNRGVLGHTGLIILASGLVLGEGFGSVVGLSLRGMGVGPVSCWGCGVGGGGYCGGC